MKRVNISKAIIEKAFKEGWHDSLHYYVQLKSVYKKPIFYNYSYRKLALKINVAPSSISKHVKVLIENNLAHVKDGHLCFYSPLNSILQNNIKDITIINLPVQSYKRAMVDQLRGVIIIQNLNNQKKAIVTRSAIVNKCKSETAIISKQEYKFLKKNGGQEQVEKNINSTITLSNKKFGFIFNRSSSSGKTYQKRLNSLGIIKSKARFNVIIDKVSPKMDLDFKVGRFVSTKNQFVEQLSNEILSSLSMPISTIKKEYFRNNLRVVGSPKH